MSKRPGITDFETFMFLLGITIALSGIHFMIAAAVFHYWLIFIARVLLFGGWFFLDEKNHP